MRRYSDKHSSHTLSELNVTPLLDLAFVLLIIFMITTPLMENTVDLELPKQDATQNPLDPQKVHTVALDRNEALSFDAQPIAKEDLAGRLLALRESEPEAAVVVRAHRELAVQKLVETLAEVRAAKIKRVGVVTIEEQ